MVMDIPFSPYDDISYHTSEIKTGVRCVIIRPYNDVRTDYIQRDLQDIIDKLCLLGCEGSRINDLETSEIPYMSKNGMKKLIAIYSSNTFFQGPVVRYNNVPLIYSNACIITGENFTDLTMEECFAIVKSAKALTIDRLTTVSVNITDHMDSIPRVIIDEK